jgi:hypothetical protein
MAKRGVIYIVWGKARSKKLEEGLRRSVQSVYKVHPGIGITVKELPEGASLLDKAKMYDLLPYDQTVYLDADTEVLDRLDFGFEMADRHGVAVSICECPYARRYEKSLTGEVVEYNTGVVFFTKGEKAEPLFRRWAELAPTMDSSVRFVSDAGPGLMPLNDQASFAAAVQQLSFNPYTLPYNWNLRPGYHKIFFGPVKVWHDYGPVPKELREFNAQQSEKHAIIEPFSLIGYKSPSW